MPSIDDQQGYYGKDLEAMTFAVNYHQWIYDEIAPYLGQHVIEVGAGNGNFTELLVNHEDNQEVNQERQVVAYEPDARMFDGLRDKMKGIDSASLKNEFFNGVEGEEKPESIVYINVLEHIENDLEALEVSYQSLQVGGHIIIFVPALPFLYSELDAKVGHFRRYTKKGLLSLVENAGFVVEKVKYFDLAGILPWWLFFVLLKKTTTEANVGLYDKAVVPIVSRFEKKIKPFIGKNIIVVGKKAHSSS